MNTISILLHNRPELFEGSIMSLLQCQDLDKFHLLCISIDGGGQNSDRCSALARTTAEQISSGGIIDVEVVEHKDNLGLAGHPIWVMRHVFGVGSELHVSLEDDAVVKPDFLRMALYWSENRRNWPDCLLLSGSNHQEFGRSGEVDPFLLVESSRITSPFCWATTSDRFPTIDRCWNFKKHFPVGWDYSLTMGMKLAKMVAMHPVLSRCQNVGREGGVNETPETFDKTQLGLVYRQEPYDGPYYLVGRIPREQLDQFDDWMLKELENMDEQQIRELSR